MKTKILFTIGIFCLVPLILMSQPFGQLVRKFHLSHMGPGPISCNKNYLFIGNTNNDTIFIYNLNNGNYVGFKKTAFSDYGFFSTETRLFVGTNGSTLVAYNISDIGNWSIVQTVTGLDNGWMASWANDTSMIAWNGHWAGTYQFFDISGGSLVAKCKVGVGGNPYSATRYQNYIFVANAYNQDRRIDISTPTSCTVTPWGSNYGQGITSTNSGFIISDAALSTAPFLKEIRNQSGTLTGSLAGQEYQNRITLPDGYMAIANSSANNTILYDIYDGTFTHPVKALFNNTQGQYTFNSTYILRMVNDSCEVYSRFSPNIQATNITFSNVQTNQLSFNWTDGNGSKRAVFIKQDSVGTPVPVYNTTYTANTVFGSGTQIGTSGWYCVFNGATHTNTIIVTNLLPNTKYRVMVCEYNGNPGSEQYITTAATNNPIHQQTSSSSSGWTPVTSGTLAYLTWVHFPDINTGYAVGETGTILKTTNAGLTWTTLTSGTSTDLFSVHFENANLGFVSGNNGIILKTSNGGSSWTSQTSGTGQWLRSVFFTAPDTGYVVGGFATARKTVNGGSSWTGLNTGQPNSFVNTFFTSPIIGYAVGFAGTIRKTLDGGSNWSGLPSGTINELSAVYFPSATTGYVVGGHYYGVNGLNYDSSIIRKTINAGATWLTQIPPSNSYLTGVYFTDLNTGYAVGTGGKIYGTVNGGTSWTIQPSGTTKALSSVYFPSPNVGIIVGESGTILRITSLSTPTTQASNITFSNVQTNQLSFNWTDGNGSKRAVFIKQDSLGTSTLINNTTYTANTIFGSGSQIGTTGWYCVFNGSTHTATTTITNLMINTNYRLMVCEYNGNPGSEQYNASTATNNPKTQKTCTYNIPTNGLFGYWPFNGNANDASGNANNGTINGTTLTSDRFGNINCAYYFDANASYITVNDSPDFHTNTFSISVWAQWDDINSSNITFITGKGVENFEIHTGGGSGINGIRFIPAGFAASGIDAYNCLQGGWNHVVVTYNGSVSNVFVNGTLVAERDSITGGSNLSGNTNPFYIGRREFWQSNYFHGKLDDVRFYNRALNTCEIQSLYQESGSSPTTQASNISFSNVQTYQLSFNWTDGNGSKRAVFIKQDSVGTSTPINNTSYTANTVFGSGAQIGTSGWYCVFNGSTHTLTTTITNLSPNSNYRIMVCEYNGVAGSEQYNTSVATNNPKTQKTCSSGTTIPTNGLVAWYPFNGNANDASGNGNNGTVNGATLSTDRFGNVNKSYSFNGTSNYINVLPSSSLNTGDDLQSSICAWVKGNSIGGEYIYLGTNYSVPSYECYFGRWDQKNNAGQFNWVGTGGPWNVCSSATTLITDTWYFFVSIFDYQSKTIKIYINGGLESQCTFNIYNRPNNPLLEIGRNPWPESYMNGIIDDVRIYNRALSDCEISALYQEGITTSTQASNITFSNVQTNQFSFNWTDGNGSKRAVFIKQDSVGTSTPNNNMTYTANTAFGSGSQIGTSGWYCVFNGTTHTSGVTVTNLLPNTNYRVMVCEYSGNPGAEQYNTLPATNNPKTQKTILYTIDRYYSFYVFRSDLESFVDNKLYPNNWYYIVVTRSVNTLIWQLYINGVLKNSVPAENAAYNLNSLSVGYNNWGGPNSFYNGIMDELRISNIVRTGSEISTHYNSNQQFGVDANTVGLWHFNESSGTSVVNSVNSVAGTLYNGVAFVNGKFNNALKFDGINDYGNLNFDPPDPVFTNEFWIKFDTVMPTNQCLLYPFGSYVWDHTLRSHTDTIQQASNIVFTNVQNNQLSFNWTDGKGAKKVVFIKQDSVGTAVPINGTTYTSNTNFGSGSQIGTTGWYCVFNGTTHTSGVTVTSLLPNTKYRIMVCQYNGNPGLERYNTLIAIDNPKNQKTGSSFVCGSVLTINHVADTVAPVNKIITYGTVTNIPGEPSKCWITSNLGADHQATAVNDATEASAGWYWQFNRKQGYKHDGTNRTPNTTWISSISENSDWTTGNDPCVIELGPSWRIPTYTEWYNVDNTGGWINWNGPWNSLLKLHTAGYLGNIDGMIYNRGQVGNYWSSTQFDATSCWNLTFNSGGSHMFYNSKAYGLPLRCLSNAVGATTTPTVTTTSISNITNTVAIGGGNVTSDGGANVTSRGVCWSTTSYPTISDSHTNDGIGIGTFTSTISGLTSNTTYYIRAYATNGIGTAYGNQVTCTTLSYGLPCPGVTTITYEGKTYNTVQIGTQCWFKENLNIGTRINANAEQTDNGIIEKYCINDVELNCDVYGGLYQWAEIVKYVNGATNNTSWNPVPNGPIQGICPQGWHIPSSLEWSTITNYLGGQEIAGGKMKEIGTTHWNPPNMGATNESGFTALAAGYRLPEGLSGALGDRTYFRHSYELNSTWGSSSYAERDHAYLYYSSDSKTFGFSVRCLKDTCTSYSSVGVSITPSSNPVCSGTSVIFTATPTNGGTNPSYQWKKGGSNIIGATNSIYSYIPANNDVITCVMTSNAQCITGSPATSNIITMIVNLPVPVSVIIFTSGNYVCSGTNVTFIANVVNGGSAPVYQWKVNGNNVGTNISTYVYAPANNDAVTCLVTSNITCTSGNPATSNTINMFVSPTLPVSVSISASTNPVCTGAPVTFTATTTNGGSSPVYQWKVNGVNAGINSSTFSYTPANGDVITCILTSDVNCVSNNPATSNQIVMSSFVLIPTITGSTSVCLGSIATSYTTESNMTGYSWNVSSGGQIVSGSGTNTVSVMWNIAGPQTISVSYGNAAGCVAPTPTILNVNVITTPAPAGNISGPTNVCVSTQGVIYSVDPIINATNYLWKVPLGVTIASGTGTHLITVNFSSSTFIGDISVKGANACFSGAQSPNLTVAANALLTGQVTLNNITIPPTQQECLAAQSITTAGSGTTFLIEGGGEVTLIASQFIRFLPGTTVQENGFLHAFITSQCLPCSSLNIPMTDSNLLIATHTGDMIPVFNDRSSIKVYPNPTAGSFTLELEGEIGTDVVRVEIHSMRGEKLFTEELKGERRHVFSLSDRPVGVYFIRVITGTGVETIKVIRQ